MMCCSMAGGDEVHSGGRSSSSHESATTPTSSSSHAGLPDSTRGHKPSIGNVDGVLEDFHVSACGLSGSFEGAGDGRLERA